MRRRCRNTKSPELCSSGLAEIFSQRVCSLKASIIQISERSRPERLQNLDVFRLEAFGAFGHVELNGLAFLKAAESAGSDGREMYEDIFAVLAADKAESLRIVKPLYSSLFHCVVPVFLNFLLRRSVAAWSG